MCGHDLRGSRGEGAGCLVRSTPGSGKYLLLYSRSAPRPERGPFNTSFRLVGQAGNQGIILDNSGNMSLTTMARIRDSLFYLFVEF